MATAAWLKSADAEESNALFCADSDFALLTCRAQLLAYATLRTRLLATSFVLDGSGVSTRVKFKGQRQMIAVSIRRRTQLPNVPVRIIVFSS